MDPGRELRYAMPRLDLSAQASYAAAGQECDLVMKGGISSGIVYPRAVCHLATANRLRRIGGTSAGAMAAAAAAAAEHGRDQGGFAKLNRLPDTLGSRLGDLFQPSPQTSTIFQVLTAWLEPSWGLPRKLMTAAWRIIRGARLGFAATAIVLLVPVLAVTVLLDGSVGGLAWLVAVLGVIVGVLARIHR